MKTELKKKRTHEALRKWKCLKHACYTAHINKQTKKKKKALALKKRKGKLTSVGVN